MDVLDGETAGLGTQRRIGAVWFDAFDYNDNCTISVQD